jgi:phosphotransferase system  glucose/maltose/N-acetylglucosamine-specific IIC component
MPVDVRLPISGLFIAVGLLLLGYGAGFEGLGTTAGKLNAIWGGVMLLFGVLIGYYGLRTERRSRSITERNATQPGTE